MTTQAIQQIKKDMDDFDISIASVARRAGYNENRIRQILKGLNTSTFVINVVRQTVDQLIAKSIKKRHSKNPVEYAPFDDGTDDRDLFCAGIPKNLALLSVGVQP